MTDVPVSSGSGSPRPTPSPSSTPQGGAPRWLSPTVLALAVFVLGSHVFYVIGLSASGVTSTDGELAYGVRGGDVGAFLPPVVSHVVAFASLWAVLLGPFHTVGLIAVAAWLLWSTWRRRSILDASAVGALLASSAVVVLLAYWGDELMVWIID